MKQFSIFMLGFSLMMTTTALADTPEVINFTLRKVYVPQGFDSNDHIQIVGEGSLPNGCYKPATTEVRVDTKNHTITIEPKVYRYNGLCFMMIVPYSQVIEVGVLSEGTYTIRQYDQQIGTLQVAKATTKNPDDYLYAPITQAFVEKESGGNKLTVMGNFITNCLELTDVRVNVLRDTIVVQPISEYHSLGRCLFGRFSFNRKITLEDMASGRYLLHVRALNASAINTLIDIQ